MELDEHWVRGHFLGLKDPATGRVRSGGASGHYTDLTFKTAAGNLAHIQMVETDKNGNPRESDWQKSKHIFWAEEGSTVQLIARPGALPELEEE